MQITLENLLVIWGFIVMTWLLLSIALDIYYARKRQRIEKLYYAEAYKALNELKKQRERLKEYELQERKDDCHEQQSNGKTADTGSTASGVADDGTGLQ